ncbi:hypothetical protein [Pseudomonas sp. BF-B-26]|uniref:hypothetical protein n=1 Tax=Pseudomonas sp. BF-B-26 TaxID=2832400 RepID=UPI001CBB53B8|nr:hypothetical protein [Pseudomonas sp. BF-B-26]
MFKYILPLYWTPSLRVRVFNSDHYAITPICFAMDCQSGLILSHSFSYGLARTDLLNLAMLAFRENHTHSGGGSYMFRSAFGDLSLAVRKLNTDCTTLSLTNLKYTKSTMYDWHKAGILLEDLFYDWPNYFISELDDYRCVSPLLLTRLIEIVISRFNCLVESGGISFKLFAANQSA